MSEVQECGDHVVRGQATHVNTSPEGLAVIKLGLRLVSTAESGIDAEQQEIAKHLVKALETEAAALVITCAP